MKKYILIIIILNASHFFCQDILQVLPEETDSTIDDWFTPHLVYLTEVDITTKKLFLYLPGAYENPEEAQLILKLVSEEGYNAISLSYPNDFGINITCSESADSLCYENIRMEIIYGVDLSEEVNVNMANSLNNRLIMLLLYLNNKNPESGWDKYLANDENIDWSKIIVAGHSQGGGHAAMIAKYNNVARLILLSAPTDFSEYFRQPSFWLADSFITNINSIYAFAHQQDGLNRFTRIWRTMKLDQFGGTIDIDYNPFPFENSHILTTNIMPTPTGSYHTCVVIDSATPKDSLGEAVFKPIWKYLCFYEQPIFVEEEDNLHKKDFILLSNYPNPFNPSTTIKYYVPSYQLVTIQIYNLLGELVVNLINEYEQPGFSQVIWNGKNSNGENIASGIYMYKMTAGNFIQMKKMIMLK